MLTGHEYCPYCGGSWIVWEFFPDTLTCEECGKSWESPEQIKRLHKEKLNLCTELTAAQARIAELEAKLAPQKGDKNPYGEHGNVLLTATEYQRLCSGHGGQLRVDKAIALLDLHIGAKGKDTYKSHYMAMKKWVFDALEEKDAKSRRGRSSQNERNMDIGQEWLNND